MGKEKVLIISALHELVDNDPDFGILHQYNSRKVKEFWDSHTSLRHPHLIVVGILVQTGVNNEIILTEHLDVFIRVGTASRQQLQDEILSKATELRTKIKQWNLHNTPIAQSLRHMYFEQGWKPKRIAEYLDVIVQRVKQHKYVDYDEVAQREYRFREGIDSSDKARHAFAYILLCDVLGITRDKTRWELLSKDVLPTYHIKNFVRNLSEPNRIEGV